MTHARSLNQFKRSFFGALPRIWSRIPQDVMLRGECNGWLTIKSRVKSVFISKEKAFGGVWRRVLAAVNGNFTVNGNSASKRTLIIKGMYVHLQVMNSTLNYRASVFLPKIRPPRVVPRTSRFCPKRVKYSFANYEYKPPNCNHNKPFNPGVTTSGKECKICVRLGRRCHMHLNQTIKLTSVVN